jgi:cyclopropane fatty-acyl-phospholipid synthase-like methyltransferase
MLTSNHHNHEGSEPSEFLVENFELLPKGKALDIAMGSGRNAVYLAKMGFEVEGVDISPEAASNAIELARNGGAAIQTKVANLEKDYRIAESAYDVIICFNYLQRSLFPQIKAGLKKGGMIVYETYIIDQAQFGRPRNPDFLLQYNELLNLFRDFRCLRYREGIFAGRGAIASLIALKV